MMPSVYNTNFAFNTLIRHNKGSFDNFVSFSSPNLQPYDVDESKSEDINQD